MPKRAVAVIIKGNEILLMRRIKGRRDYFVFPGGGVEKGETIKDAAIREIKEEFGLDVKIERFLFKIRNGSRDEFYFLAKDFSGVPEIGGEEKERMTESNQYHPAWKKLSELKSLPNLYPKKARQRVAGITAF